MALIMAINRLSSVVQFTDVVINSSFSFWIEVQSRVEGCEIFHCYWSATHQQLPVIDGRHLVNEAISHRIDLAFAWVIACLADALIKNNSRLETLVGSQSLIRDVWSWQCCIQLYNGWSMSGESWPKSPKSRQEHPPNTSWDLCGKACRRRRSTWASAVLPTMDIPSIVMYLMSEKDCWSWLSCSPSKSLKSIFVVGLRRESRVWPAILNAAATQRCFWRSSRKQCIRYCTAKKFRQRKILSKATVRQFVRNLFSSNVGRRLLLFDHSVVALLLIVYLHIHEYFWFHTCSFVKNLVRNLI